MSNLSPLDGMAAAHSPGGSGWWIVAGVVGGIVLVILLVIAQFFRLWLQAYMSNAGVRMTDLIGMYLRKVEMTTVVFVKIQPVKAGIRDMTVNDLESHSLADGRHEWPLMAIPHSPLVSRGPRGRGNRGADG